MRNVPINEAEAILEPYWDSGESYPEHKKYSVLSTYSIAISPAARARVQPAWCAVEVAVEHNRDMATPAVVLEKSCSAELEGYDVIRLFAAIPSGMRVVLSCVIDGGISVVLDEQGRGENREYDGEAMGKSLTFLRMEVYSCSPEPQTMSLLWLGLANREKERQMGKRASPYTEEWPGCFAEQWEIKPYLGLYFHERELEELRRKIRCKPFDRIMEGLREQARRDLAIEPEKQIGEYLPRNSRRWERDRDMKKHKLDEAMERLAFVGLVDGKEEMLRLACRMALSAAHHRHWCESFMGAFPGATWHHRSFAEEAISKACALVLDWAGSLLTWHGRHIIQDAIIMKGLPRIEADFMTVEYIRHMNQGIVFSGGRILALLALKAEYPRYSLWLAEAEKDLHEMVNAYIQEDGGTLEGPGYWNYTMANVLPAFFALARDKGESLSAYLPEAVRRSGDYALAMLSTERDGLRTVAVGDGHARPYDSIVAASFASLSDRPEWKGLYSRIAAGRLPPSKELLIMAPEPAAANDDGHILEEGLIHLPATGQTSLVHHTPDAGRIKLHLASGPSFYTHYHEDKGSLVLEAAGEALLAERGMCDYSHPYGRILGKADMHNLLMPESEEGMYVQPGSALGGKAVHAGLEDGVFLYTTRLAAAWQEGLYKRNYRRIFSPSPYLYLVHDEVEYGGGPLASSFRLNTRCSMEETAAGFLLKGSVASVSVTCMNWRPERVWFGEYGYDEHIQPVSQLRLYTGKAAGHSLITVLEVVPGGAASMCRLENGALRYGEISLAAQWREEELRISCNGWRFSARDDEWRKEREEC